MRSVHPDDLAPTLGAAEKALPEPSGARGQVPGAPPGRHLRMEPGPRPGHLDAQGEPVRMIGVGWESNESRSARDALSRALRHMSDGFLAVDDRWRITFLNLAAERMLGSSEEELSGRVLWKLLRPAGPRSGEALPGGRRRAAARRLRHGHSGHRAPPPPRGSVPGPDGLSLYFTDVTEIRRHEDERSAAETAAAERAARIAELTASLAKATTSRDVVAAVARRVLPPFGATTGLVVQAIEDDRAYNVGMGYPPAFLDTINSSARAARNRLEPILSGTPLFLSTRAEYTARYPNSPPGRPRRANRPGRSCR